MSQINANVQRHTSRAARYAIVIPAYNEAATIRDVAARALAQVERVIVVDDGSSDGTAQALSGLPVTVLRNAGNQGKAASLWRGAQCALEQGAERIVTLDGDGQHLPEEIPRLLEAAERCPECIVIGARSGDISAFPRSRYRANRVADFWISWAAGRRLRDTQSGFRVYPAPLFRELRVRHDKSRSFVLESEILIEACRAGHRCVSVPVSAVYGQRPRR
ncbi:MAG: glycosyltransferase family 2 protein, partial [Gammaproteobacteria bacterium]|nr:glycosyltransferase family 2 protein [Gammaproteobacteria bacterium]